MPHIKPTREQIMRLAESPDDGPVVMLNLLRFADKAAGDAGKSGADSYETYGDQMGEIMAQRGIKLLWRGRADSVVIGDDDGDAWDMVLARSTRRSASTGRPRWPIRGSSPARSSSGPDSPRFVAAGL